MDGYVQHANVGSRSKIEIDESKSNFRVSNGKITANIEGSITQEFKGKTDQFGIQLNAVPFSGSDGGVVVAKFTTISSPSPDQGSVFDVDVTYEELKKYAATVYSNPGDGKHLIMVDGVCYNASMYAESDTGAIYIAFTNIAVDTNLNRLINVSYVIAVNPDGTNELSDNTVTEYQLTPAS